MIHQKRANNSSEKIFLLKKLIYLPSNNQLFYFTKIKSIKLIFLFYSMLIGNVF